MERLCKNLREHAMKIINYEKKEMISLTDEENESYEKQKVCYICKKEFDTDEFDTDENDKNEFNTDENDMFGFNADENDENEFNNDENDENEFNNDENDENEFNTDENEKNALKPYDKVKDCYHYTGKFREAADNICNLR